MVYGAQGSGLKTSFGCRGLGVEGFRASGA